MSLLTDCGSEEAAGDDRGRSRDKLPPVQIELSVRDFGGFQVGSFFYRNGFFLLFSSIRIVLVFPSHFICKGKVLDNDIFFSL